MATVNLSPSGTSANDWTIVDGTLKTIPGHGVDLIS